jgi:hypothetical protein
MSHSTYPEHATGQYLGHVDADDIKGEKYGGVNVHTGPDAMVMDAEKRVSYGEDSIVQEEFDTEHTTTHRNLKVSFFCITPSCRSTLSSSSFRYCSPL